MSPSILPLPADVQAAPGQFGVPEVFQTELIGEAGPALAHLQRLLPELSFAPCQSEPDLSLRQDAQRAELGTEGYELRVGPAGIVLCAAAPAGLFYGVVTLWQLLRGQPSVACLQITDTPRFGWRGLMLDAARHFIPVPDLLRVLDELARLKLNVFHWHLTDDQGWRLLVPAYPDLIRVGSRRARTLVGHLQGTPHTFDERPHGGFYSEADIAQVLAYAAARHITVVPEIDLPGHAQAALVAYPEFGSGERAEVGEVWGISERVFHPRAQTMDFLRAVLGEVMRLFPGRYICIGGDECPTTEWEASAEMRALATTLGLSGPHTLQRYVTRELCRYLLERGRVPIGWEEILDGDLGGDHSSSDDHSSGDDHPSGGDHPSSDDLSRQAVGLIWLREEQARPAVLAGHPVVICAHRHFYLDYYQSASREGEPLAQGGCLSLRGAYDHDPLPPDLNPDQQRLVLGVQANLWTEYLPTPQRQEYMLFPRLLAVAELAWSPQAKRHFADFEQRLSPHLGDLTRRGFSVRQPRPGDDPAAPDPAAINQAAINPATE
ncbi:beta-N-acetylhexosaminidase [Deinococcus sp.]|uniref:beta-N-acetylhexosaminidase n=1 Tax=Deinococcus sp. TaxID=47478 RepID=UPI0025F7C9F0|nr:beta-N-acetylhexosaminidase [Deinococcus sp.]